MDGSIMEDSSLCICGHPDSEHHLSWLPGGGMLVEECEYYSSNETSGMMFVGDHWVEHCYKFQLDTEGG